MLGAIVSLLLIAAAAFAVTKVGGLITLALIAAVLILAYRRLSLLAFTVTFTVLFAAYVYFAPSGTGALVWKGFLALLLAALWLLNVRRLRKALITRPFMKTYLKLLPTMSATEREALEAGTVWWDGELFTGAPRWEKLLAARPPKLSTEEQAFLDGPCEELCRLLDDWNITHERGDLPPHVWEFMKSRGFFAMIIPKKYGGLEFSAYAHSCVLVKLASRSPVASSTVAVPNSLGPRGAAATTTAPRSRRSTTCRASRAARKSRASRSPDRAPAPTPARSPTPASSAAAPGRDARSLGLKLNFDKRYITLAPVATVIGLAFRMFDPERLLCEKTDLGITVALIPRNTPGVTVGRRHFPINVPFQNGPVHGKDVFVPLDAIVGGPKMAGQRLAHAGRAALGRPLHLAALERHRRRQGGRVGHRRLRAHPPPVQHAGGPLRGRGDGDRADGRPHLHHGRGALGHGRRDRRRREAVRALGDAQVPRAPSWAGRSRTMRWTCTAARASASGRATTSAAATRSCRSRSRSRARTS